MKKILHLSCCILLVAGCKVVLPPLDSYIQNYNDLLERVESFETNFQKESQSLFVKIEDLRLQIDTNDKLLHEGLDSLKEQLIFLNSYVEIAVRDGLSDAQRKLAVTGLSGVARSIDSASIEEKGRQEEIRRVKRNQAKKFWENLDNQSKYIIFESITKLDKNLEGSESIINSLDAERLYLFSKAEVFEYTKGDLTNLHFMPFFHNLRKIDISNNQDITGSDLSFINHLYKLEILEISKTGVTDLDALSHLSSLKYLDCSYNNKIIDLSPLENLTNLKEIDCQHNKITSLFPLRKLNQLEEIFASNNQLENLDGIGQLKSLKNLDIGGNYHLTNITTLKQLISNKQSRLEYIYIPNKFYYELNAIKKLKNSKAQIIKMEDNFK